MNLKSIFLFIVFGCFMFGCEPVDERKDIICEMSKEELKPILKDIFIYEASRNTKALDSLTLTYIKPKVYKHLYQKHNTSRLKVQKAIECLTLKKELIPILKDLQDEFAHWQEDPELNFYGSKDSIQ
ncbi:MAG: hypothetical protein ACPGSD_10185 [Flavobacteriales bacterium]